MSGLIGCQQFVALSDLLEKWRKIPVSEAATTLLTSILPAYPAGYIPDAP